MESNSGYGRGVANKGAARQNYMSNPRFAETFQKLLSTRRRNTPGIDSATKYDQAIAKVKGRDNKRKLRERASISTGIDPVKAAMEMSVRNRSVEQGGNTPTATNSAASGRSTSVSALESLRNRGVL